MKKILLLSFLVTALFTSCSKKDLNPPANKLLLGKWKLSYISYQKLVNDTNRYLVKNFDNQGIVYEFKNNGFLTIHGEPQPDTSELYPYEVFKGNYFDSDTMKDPSAYLDIVEFAGKKYSVSFPWNTVNNRPEGAQLSDFYDHTVIHLKKLY